MTLIERTAEVCRRLSTTGWRDYLLRVSDLDIGQDTPRALASELARALKRIDRGAAGFQDFALEGVRGIEPGNPAHSFLFHAVARPLLGQGEVREFPTPDEIEAIENYVYGVNPPSISDLREMSGRARLAIVVYAVEYRPAIQTVHQKHADMCFSRTGIARIGNAARDYVPASRGYASLHSQPGDLHVIPCRYSAYIAAQLTGNAASLGPMRFRKGGDDAEGNPVSPDSTRLFWVPLHKVFSGHECIRGAILDLRYSTDHRNEKLRRIHLYLERSGLPVDYSGASLKDFPFLIPESSLVCIERTDGGSIIVSPVQNALVAEVMGQDRPIRLKVVPGAATSGGSFHIPSRPSGARTAPEYVYVRQVAAEANSPAHSLNKNRDLLKIINVGGYHAVHYIDHTGDGWIRAQCPSLALDVPDELPAYSILAPPGLYPHVKEGDVFDWWQDSVPLNLKATLFPDFEGSLPTEPLSDARITANMTFRQVQSISVSEPIFTSDDDTYTAIVSTLNAGSDAPTELSVEHYGRVSTLTDVASGLFAPGWDVSMDLNDDENSPNGVLHMAAYGGGSPFLEDVRLCAAESGFWPALAPDTTRLYQPPTGPTVTPIPQSRLGWDGLAAPKLLRPGLAQFYAPSHADYVQEALRNGFDFPRIGATTADEYKMYTLLMALVYQAINALDTIQKMKWAVQYFDLAPEHDADLVEAQTQKAINLHKPYRFYLIYPTSITQQDDPLIVHVGFERSVLAFASTARVLFLDTLNAGWLTRAF